jgi:hypothetical protein
LLIQWFTSLLNLPSFLEIFFKCLFQMLLLDKKQNNKHSLLNVMVLINESV